MAIAQLRRYPEPVTQIIADFIRDKLYGRGTSTTGAASRKEGFVARRSPRHG